MVDQDKRPFEEKLAIVDGWIAKIGSEGKVDEVDPMLIRDVLKEFGANFEISDQAKGSLGRYSNRNKQKGLQEVWGEKAAEFKKWVKEEYIPQYEAEVGREFPTLYDPKTGQLDNIKHSGMMQFFGELAAFAAGEKTFPDYKRLTEHRADRGRRWRNNDPEHPFVLDEPNAPFSPEFPSAAWQKIKSWKV